MKVFISADIEGCTGIVTFAQCSRPDGNHYDYPFARRMMHHDVNAAIRGAKAAGATKIVVKDGHATCRNLLVDELEPGTELISGIGPARDGMMDGIDETFDAAMLVGYHAMAGASASFMEHALAGTVHRFWINGTLCGEILTNALVASGYGVPTVLVTSDEGGCQEANKHLPGAMTFATKQALGKYVGKLFHPSETGPGIEEAARAGVDAVKQIQRIQTAEPTLMRAEFHKVEEADLAAMYEKCLRIDGNTIEWTRPTVLEAHRAMLNIFQLSIRGRNSGD